jgi:pyruvate-formate lyase-activating enzyme
MKTLSLRSLIMQHQSTGTAVRVSIVNSSFTGLVVWCYCCSTGCFFCENRIFFFVN